MPTVVARHRRPVVALWVVSFVNGGVLASWAPRIPQVKADLSLSDADLGWVLLGVAAGSVPALLAAARLLRRVSARAVCAASSVGFAGGLALVALAPNGWALAGSLAVLGAAGGGFDVAMNTAAIDFQRSSGTQVLSRLHGGYSLGVLAGATSGALASQAGLSVLAHFVVVSTCLVVLSVGASAALPRSGLAAGPVAGAGVAPNRRPEIGFGRVLTIPVSVAVAAVAALLVEGTITDWSALLVSRDYAGGPTVGAVALVVFSCAMFISRTAGDAVIARLGAVATLRVSAAVIATASGCGLQLQADPWVAVTALGCVGLAVGPLFPLLITEAGRRGQAGVAASTARITALGYGAYLGGPPLVGLLADHHGLKASITLTACSCAVALAATSGPTRR